VTNGQYTEFLNAVDPTGRNTLGLFGFGAIERNLSSSDGAKYALDPALQDLPVIYVTWFDAIRFANWMHNGQGGPGSTEDGSYLLLGNSETPSNWQNISRNSNATVVLPTEDEWYKAAFHQPSLEGGDIDNYWLYPTRTNDTPYSVQPPGDDAPDKSNTANFRFDDGFANGYNDGYAATGTTSRPSHQDALTRVGAYAESLGPYGTYDQGGNVNELLEGPFNAGAIGNQALLGLTRGGAWTDSSNIMSALIRVQTFRNDDFSHVGFRVASTIVPESSSILVAGLGTSLLLLRSRLSRI
jgi:formylglycine-generating enzyme